MRTDGKIYVKMAMRKHIYGISWLKSNGTHCKLRACCTIPKTIPLLEAIPNLSHIRYSNHTYKNLVLKAKPKCTIKINGIIHKLGHKVKMALTLIMF